MGFNSSSFFTDIIFCFNHKPVLFFCLFLLFNTQCFASCPTASSRSQTHGLDAPPWLGDPRWRWRRAPSSSRVSRAGEAVFGFKELFRPKRQPRMFWGFPILRTHPYVLLFFFRRQFRKEPSHLVDISLVSAKDLSEFAPLCGWPLPATFVGPSKPFERNGQPPEGDQEIPLGDGFGAQPLARR